MRYWDFRLNGVAASEKGILVAQLPEYARPAERRQDITIPGRSGALFRREQSPHGRVYDTVEYPVEMLLEPGSSADALLAWVEDGGQLELGNQPGWLYEATLTGQMITKAETPDMEDGYRSVTALFTCQPWRVPAAALRVEGYYPEAAYAAYGDVTIGRARGRDRARFGVQARLGGLPQLDVRLIISRMADGLDTASRECTLHCTGDLDWDVQSGRVYDPVTYADLSAMVDGGPLSLPPRAGVHAESQDTLILRCEALGEGSPELTDNEAELGAKAMIRLTPEWRRL